MEASDGPAPGLLVFASDGAEIAAAVARSGARLLASRPIEEALDTLDGQAAAAAVLVAATEATPALEWLLSRLDAEAAAGRARSVAILPLALVDLAWALAPHPDVALLADPLEAEVDAALAMALARPMVAAGVREERNRPAELRRLSEEAGRIARTLAALSEGGSAYTPPPPASGGTAAPPGAASIRALIRARRLRDRFFDAAFFADPAWDMLLDLMAARLEGRAVSVSSLCIAAAVPSTTALRWIKLLTTAGLLVRVADGGDGRRVFVELADSAAEALAGYFAEAARQGLGSAI